MRQVDVGTQSVKVLVYSLRTHGVVGRGQHEYQLQSTRPGMAEQPPSVWEEGLQAALRDAMQSHDTSEVRALAISGQQHGLVAMDADGAVSCLTPASVHWSGVLSV
jgi:xylulokinase